MTEGQEVVVVPTADLGEWGRPEEVRALAARLRVMLPNGKDFADGEMAAIAQYCRLMDLNPFRGEVYAYKSRGRLCLVDGYKALVRWALHKSPYSSWDEDLPLEADQVARVRVWILRQDARPLLHDLLKTGMDAKEAIRVAAVYADGVVTKADLQSRDGTKEPPTGWTWRDVARKRALKNALNMSHGAPSPREMAAMSWQANGVDTVPDDWEGAEKLQTPTERERSAEVHAVHREAMTVWDAMTPEEQQAKFKANTAILRGAESEGFDDEPPQAEQAPPPEPQKAVVAPAVIDGGIGSPARCTAAMAIASAH